MRPGKSDEREDVVLGVLDDSRDLRGVRVDCGGHFVEPDDMPSVELKCSLVPGLIEAALARGLQDITLAIPRDRNLANRGVPDVLIVAFPPALCQVIYTTNSIESLNSTRASRRLAQGRLVKDRPSRTGDKPGENTATRTSSTAIPLSGTYCARTPCCFAP